MFELLNEIGAQINRRSWHCIMMISMKHHDVNEHWVTTPPLLRHVGAHGVRPQTKFYQQLIGRTAVRPYTRNLGQPVEREKGTVPFSFPFSFMNPSEARGLSPVR